MSKKWQIAIIGTIIHLMLGTVYAWSFFQTPVAESSGWTNSEAAWAFSISIFMLGVTSAWAGGKMSKYGPRKMALIGGLLYGLGYLISGYALSIQSLPLLYLGFGFVGGIGLGLAYVTPVATVSAWFTKNQGLATGMVVMGFGFGALVMSKLLAPLFLTITENNISTTFYYIGVIMFAVIPLSALFLKMPPSLSDSSNIDVVDDKGKVSFVKDILGTPFIVVWLVFLIIIIAGMIFISFQSPLLQDLMKLQMPTDTDFANPILKSSLEVAGATLIAVSSIFNGLGRFAWGGVSDKIGQMQTFRLLLVLQALIFVLLIFVTNAVVFSVLVCLVLFSYGGSFGVLPSLAKDIYGSNLMASAYGAFLTAWGVGGIIGPQIVAFMVDNYPADKASLYSFIIGAVLLIVGLGVSFMYNPKKKESNCISKF